MTATGLGRTAVPHNINRNEAVWVQTETGQAYLYPQQVEAVLYETVRPSSAGLNDRSSVQVVLRSGNIIYLHDERSFEDIARLLLQENFPEIE